MPIPPRLPINKHKLVSALQARHKGLRLLGIPHWATPGDVSRMAERIGVDGIKTVKMQYDGGLPTGKTVLTFERLGQASYASHLLVDAHISSIPIQVEGFERAVEKNDGFEDEIKSPVAPGNALILGFPSSWRLQDVNDFLFPYKLDYFGTPLEAISCILQTSQSARWSVALASLSESHRLVRHLHMRRFDLTGKGEKTSLQCQVLYLS